MNAILFLFGTWIGMLILPIWVLGLTIAFIKALSDDPNNPDKPYFYTAVEPGRIKPVLRGGKVVRYLMNYAGHRFSRTDSAEKDEHWNVEDGDDPVPLVPNKSISFIEYAFWPFYALQVLDWFNAIVYKVTGYVFVGFWPFQGLYIYKFTRKVQKKNELGQPLTNDQGMPILEDKIEATDHVRARVFIWHVEGQAGETVEGLKVQVRGNANVRTTNPQKALFGSDLWDVLLTNTILRALASIIRTMSINEVLMSSDTTAKDKLADSVEDAANKALEPFGIEIDDYQIIDFEAQLSPEDTAALTAKWRAEQNKEAARIEGEGRGDGRAAEITKVAHAVKTGGVNAKRAQELEALIRQADAAGKSGGVVILGSNSGDGINAALLAEVKKMNNGGQK